MRFETSSADAPRIDRLARLLGIPRPHALGHYVSLLCWVGRHAMLGDLTGRDSMDLASACQWPATGDAHILATALWDAGVLERVECDGSCGLDTPEHVIVHGWLDRQDAGIQAQLSKAQRSEWAAFRSSGQPLASHWFSKRRASEASEREIETQRASSGRSVFSETPRARGRPRTAADAAGPTDRPTRSTSFETPEGPPVAAPAPAPPDADHPGENEDDGLEAYCRKRLGPICASQRAETWQLIAAEFRKSRDPRREVDLFCEPWLASGERARRPLRLVTTWIEELRDHELASLAGDEGFTSPVASEGTWIDGQWIRGAAP